MASSVFKIGRITFPPSTPGAKVLGFASVIVSDAVMITGIRIVQGTKGVFISMPTKKDAQQQYVDVVFPVSREMRLDLSALILHEYEKLIFSDKRDTGARLSLSLEA